MGIGNTIVKIFLGLSYKGLNILLINHIVDHKSQPLQWSIARCLHIDTYIYIDQRAGTYISESFNLQKEKAPYLQLITWSLLDMIMGFWLVTVEHF